MIRCLTAAGIAALAFAGSAQARSVIDIATSECIVSQAPRDVRKLLDTTPGTGEESAAFRKLKEGFQTCSGGTVTLDADLLGAMAAYMLRADLAEAALRSGKASRMPAPATASMWFTTRVARTIEVRYAFGVCLVGADPVATTRLVRSYPDTVDEKAAINALRGKVAGCLVRGTPLRLTPADLRQVLAEPLYHNVMAAGK
jgi:hypothetical protein